MKRIRGLFAIIMIAALAFTCLPVLTGGFDVNAASVKKPAKVNGLKVKAKGSNYITLKWNRVKTKGTKGYKIYVYNGSTKKWKKIKTITSAKTLKYKIKNLKANKTYKFKVRAYTTYKRKGKTKYRYGKYSSVLSVKTKKGYSGPKASITVDIVAGTTTGTAANPAPSAPKLVSAVTLYQYDNDTKEWRTYKTYNYTYNEHGDPATVKDNVAYGYNSGRSDTSYAYKYRSDGTRERANYTGNSRWWHSLFSGAWVNSIYKGTLSYDGNGRRTAKNGTSSGTYDSGSSAGDQTVSIKWKHLIGGLYNDLSAPEDYSYKVTAQKNGILKRITRKFLLFSDDPWTEYYTFYENGLPKREYYYSKNYTNFTNNYNKETGLVESIDIVRTTEGVTYKSRLKFEYSTENCTRERYICMINSFAMDNSIALQNLWY